MSEMDLHDSVAPGSPTGGPEEGGGDRLDDLDPETPVADAVDQHTPLSDDGGLPRADTPYEVEPADLAEQERVVALDEDDYR